MDCNLPGFSVHGISQARKLEWVDISTSMGSFNPGIEPGFPALQVDSLSSEPPGRPLMIMTTCLSLRTAEVEAEKITDLFAWWMFHAAIKNATRCLSEHPKAAPITCLFLG